jgi:hypothetical protein
MVKALVKKTEINCSQKDAMKHIMLGKAGNLRNEEKMRIFTLAMNDGCVTVAYWLIAGQFVRLGLARDYLKAIPKTAFEKNRSFIQVMLSFSINDESVNEKEGQEIFLRYANKGFLSRKDLMPNDEIYAHFFEFSFVCFPLNALIAISCSRFVKEYVPKMLHMNKCDIDIRNFWQASLDGDLSTIASIVQANNLKKFPSSQEKIMTVAIMCACEHNHTLVVETLLQHFRPRWITSTLIGEALGKGNLSITQLLLDHMRYPSLHRAQISETWLPFYYLARYDSYAENLLQSFCKRAFFPSLSLAELVFECICSIQNKDFERAQILIQQLPPVEKDNALIHIIVAPLLKGNCLALTQLLVLHWKLPENSIHHGIWRLAEGFPELSELIRPFKY